jgi:hypothetical protein
MKMLSALQRTVENECRTVIRAGEWFLWMSAEGEKESQRPHPLVKQTPKGAPPKIASIALRVLHPPAFPGSPLVRKDRSAVASDLMGSNSTSPVGLIASAAKLLQDNRSPGPTGVVPKVADALPD